MPRSIVSQQTAWTVVRPNGVACWLIPKPSDNPSYAERKAMEHFGAVAWEEMKEGGYTVKSFLLIVEKDD